MAGLSRTGKLLQYVNYREWLCSSLSTAGWHTTHRPPLPSSLPALLPRRDLPVCCGGACIAGMRVTIVDGRQICGR